MRNNLLVIVLMYPDFVETVSFVELFGAFIRSLHVEIDPVDLGFCL